MKKEILLVVFFLVSVCVLNAQTSKKITESSHAEKTEIVNKQNAEISNKVGGVNSPQATNVATYDFTTGPNKYHGTTNACVDLSGTGVGPWAMIAGDANSDGQITSLDFDLWLPNARATTTGYLNTDINLDGQNTSLDFDLWLPNARAARSSQVPN